MDDTSVAQPPASDERLVSLDPRLLNCMLTQARGETFEAHVEELREVVAAARQNGHEFPLPAVRACFDGKMYRAFDGIHTTKAAIDDGWPTIPVAVRPGGLNEAQFEATRANTAHGLRRTRIQKRAVVKMALANPLQSDWSANLIAQHCQVSVDLVLAVKDEVDQVSETKPDSPPPMVEGRDGKLQPSRKRPRTRRPGLRISGGTSFDPAELEAAGPAQGEELQKPADRKQALAAFGQVVRALDKLGVSADLELELNAVLQALKGVPSAVDGADPIGALAEPYKRWVRRLGACIREFEKLAADEKYGVHIGDKITRITYDLGQARDTISQSEPVKVCPRCSGNGCHTCGRSEA